MAAGRTAGRGGLGIENRLRRDLLIIAYDGGSRMILAEYDRRSLQILLSYS